MRFENPIQTPDNVFDVSMAKVNVREGHPVADVFADLAPGEYIQYEGTEGTEVVAKRHSGEVYKTVTHGIEGVTDALEKQGYTENRSLKGRMEEANNIA